MAKIRVSVRLPAEVVGQLDREAQGSYLTRSDVIRQILGKYYEGQQAPEQRGGDILQVESSPGSKVEPLITAWPQPG